jgi:hypothetical protein
LFVASERPAQYRRSRAQSTHISSLRPRPAKWRRTPNSATVIARGRKIGIGYIWLGAVAAILLRLFIVQMAFLPAF